MNRKTPCTPQPDKIELIEEENKRFENIIKGLEQRIINLELKNEKLEHILVTKYNVTDLKIEASQIELIEKNKALEIEVRILREFLPKPIKIE